MKLIINSLEEMNIFAARLAKRAVPNDVYLLKGDLGAGKTTFSQFFGKALGVAKTISSPTFTIIKSYDGRMPFNHMDCYRLENSDEDLGFDDYFYGDGVTLIEWPQMIEEFLPPGYLTITIERISDDSRQVTVTAEGVHYNKLLEALNDEVTSY
ncbi:tRNA (adenosine(37)-N6)-threonylcarbamoyltransferase complex ATPase subunit type 1 TsaE [Macrococcus equipercicus]|uniref:tRNA threonylcarbamoyladenosine biosynthesis protein TsaE n=1 Tax=Macrococcus equipercicus TaxID=69967 RepID=A0A9Q9BW46_9STAP|nr:tRNA (adenosine(37)-N6)-threonylcarbamoyltransferase complex ATPase subunit type 1 TsaE [Macrococcus equipercicus]KAA1036563.1 tRNA (adenosine(37)-N6)-threonylcarbamoyltransferase complex ATPase subunit type 1 TsaE [Macrococcus equipercicus]UTH13507.1 tRNA (adenosine(37)-N6)-threonylcarbamoyltransferase complex ATPase subunit type 1 TsaE [Macrococcus equipercicus]